MKNNFLVFLAFVVSSAVGAALSALEILWLNSRHGFLDFVTFFVISFLGSALASAFLGLPAFVALRQFEYANLWSAALGGGVIGLLVCKAGRWGDEAQTLLMFALDGTAAGFFFWLTLEIGDAHLAKSD